MSHREKRQVPTRTKTNSSLTRRDLLKGGATVGVAGALLAGCEREKVVPEALSETNLIGASELSGETLSPERVRGMKSIFEFNLKQLQVLREFDPDEEKPLTMFRA